MSDRPSSHDLEIEAEAQSIPEWFEELSHTADAGFVVWAGDLRELFARAAWGMFTMLTNMEAVRELDETEIIVTASDREALLVKWLSEMNYRHITEHKLFRAFDVRDLEERRLVATVRGEKIDPRRHVIHTEIKAVTYHHLRLDQVGDRWRAQVVLDL